MIVFGQTVIDDPLLSPEGKDLITRVWKKSQKYFLFFLTFVPFFFSFFLAFK